MWLAVLFPGISLMRHRRRTQGILFLLLQPTLVGWLIGVWVAMRNLKRQARRRYKSSSSNQVRLSLIIREGKNKRQ
jgi:hypothetical protein